MWDLSKHERLEMEVLDGLNALKLLDHLVFCGGTMLRLCHELNRYSVDLDFWFLNADRPDAVFAGVKDYLKEKYILKTARHTQKGMLFEFTVKGYPRRLKIEIRKTKERPALEDKIAYSRFSNVQVPVRGATLEDMMKAKIETFLRRGEIRDVFDIEFLVKKGVRIRADKKQLLSMQKHIRRFRANDYRITLGSLLEFKERQYYRKVNFRLVHEKIEEVLETGK